jgi:hypothetical protein
MLTEVINAARVNFSEFMKWFTFFTGVNFIGWGWLIDKIAKNDANNSHIIVVFICVYFVIQNYLAFQGANQVLKFMIATDKAVDALLENQVHKESIISIELYKKVVSLIQLTFPSMGLLWLIFTIFILTK